MDLTVSEQVQRLFRPKSIMVLMGDETFELLEGEDKSINTNLLDILGDYIVRDLTAVATGEFIINVLCKPIKREVAA